MTWSIALIAGGVTTDLSDNDNYILTGLDGIGMAPTNRISQQGPQQHGASDVGFRLQPRKIALSLLAKGGDDTAWWTRRNALLALFRATDTAANLRLVHGGVTRQIDCFFSAEMSMAVDPDLRNGWQPVAIELIASDPTWYDPSGESVTYGISGSGQSMDVPLAVPWKVGASAIAASRQVAYLGTWDTYPIITVKGPVTDLVITNTTLGDKLDFTDLELAAGGKRIIDCRYGQKTIVDESGVNKIADLTADSNLATFRLGAHPVPLNGNNSISVSGTGLTSATEVFIQYFNRFVGV